MELSHEDAFRLNVMLANDVKAVRINESTMTVYGLSNEGESTIRLNPTCRDDKYLRRVRELLSSHVLGSPGGYPVYLKRWSRMGQARKESLERLLLLGEPEAVVAVVHASGLTGELARRAWWSLPEADSARCMLARKSIADDPFSNELAEFLVEFLPFEENSEAMMESVRLVLQPGLIGNEVRQRLWKQGKVKNSYYVGFLQTTPDELSDPLPPHHQWESVSGQLQALTDAGNPFAVQLCRCLSAQGQTFLAVSKKVMSKPANQEVMVRLLDAIGAYFSTVCFAEIRSHDVQQLASNAKALCDPKNVSDSPAFRRLKEVITCAGGLVPMLSSMLGLAAVTEAVVTPIFAHTNAIGTVMRRRLEPVTKPLLELITRLQDDSQ
ncbi:MAG: sulfur reduction protein DsrS [Gammaproteobacteria bacterium]